MRKREFQFSVSNDVDVMSQTQTCICKSHGQSELITDVFRFWLQHRESVYKRFITHVNKLLMSAMVTICQSESQVYVSTTVNLNAKILG